MAGLTTAISLAEAGLSTADRGGSSRRRPTTSAAAGAIWGPVRCGPPDRCYEWARTGLAVLSALADDPSTGVHPLSGRELSTYPAQPPAWTGLLPDLRLLGPRSCPRGSSRAGTTPPRRRTCRCTWTTSRAATRAWAGRSPRQTVTALAAVDAPVVVNCTGIGARTLVPDPELVPVRGQIVVLENPGITEFYIDHGGRQPRLRVRVPARRHGRARRHRQRGLRRPDAVARGGRADPARVRRRVPGAGRRPGASPSGWACGRCRPAVRLEPEPLDGGRVLWHNYGHGGAGMTLSWGCARS